MHPRLFHCALAVWRELHVVTGSFAPFALGRFLPNGMHGRDQRGEAHIKLICVHSGVARALRRNAGDVSADEIRPVAR